MKDKVLVVVETPFQLLCAYEYMCKHSADYDVFVRKSGVGVNDQQMDTMLVELNISLKGEFFVRSSKYLDYIRALKVFLPFVFRLYGKVVVGSYFSRFQRFISSVVLKKEMVLLDDGVATLLADKLVSEQGRRYSVFSIFELNKASYISCELNDFSFVAGKYLCGESNEYSSFFVGQKLVDIGAIDIASYIEVLEWAVSDSYDSVVHYIPHRAESLNSLEIIKSVAGVKILHSDVAIEYFMLRNGWYPKEFIP